MSQVVSLRLPDETVKRLKGIARRAGRSVNEAAARSLEEWLRQEEFADIEFRSVGAERHACLKGALPVWQLVMVARDYGMDAAKTAAHFRMPEVRVRAGLHYYEVYPQEIDDAIADNEAVTFDRLKRLLPQLEAILIPPSMLASTDDER
jgi:Ribbon-helix-helix protein, copG family.